MRRPTARRCALLLAFAAATATPTRAAQPPQLEATISSDHLGLDETLKLTVTLTRDASQVYQAYVRPDPKDFDIVSQAESELPQWTIINGRQSTRTVEQHVYLLRPRHKGPSTIPAATARIDGRELRTREFVVRVGPATRKPPAAPSDPANLSFALPSLVEPEGMRGDEDVFVEAKVDKPQTYMGDQVTVAWMLYARADILRYRTTTEPHHDDFWTEDLYSPAGKLNWERQTVKGQEYRAAVLLKRALFPLRAGRLTVTPLEAEVTTLQTAFYAGGSAVRASKPVAIEVLPLPAAGQPEGFEPTNVGQFELTGSADRTHVRAGEAITYRLVVKGRGNPRNVKMPRLDQIDGFKVYEPQVTVAIQKTDRGVEGAKTFSYLLLPRRGGDLRIPAIALDYFDADARSYKRSVLPAIDVTVSGDPEKIGSAPAETKENVLKPRIRPLRIKPHVESHIGERLLRGPAMPLALALPPSVLLSMMVVGAVRARLRRETARSKRRRARAAARRRMRTCELHIRGQRPSQFFAECARAIYEHLEYRLGSRCEAFTMEELRRVLVERGVDGALAEAVAQELEGCDFARFAASASGPGEMRVALRRVRQLLAAIERAPVRPAGGPMPEAAA